MQSTVGHTALDGTGRYQDQISIELRELFSPKIRGSPPDAQETFLNFRPVQPEYAT